MCLYFLVQLQEEPTSLNLNLNLEQADRNTEVADWWKLTKSELILLLLDFVVTNLN
jgi:hypothetical protein